MSCKRCGVSTPRRYCRLCAGIGRITAELEAGTEGAIVPDPDLRARGLLHAVARQRHDREIAELNAEGDRDE